MLEYYHKEFKTLSLFELYELMRLRQEVFIVEQNCPYLDADGLDHEAIHVIGILENKIEACTRILAPDVAYENYSSIGRVVNGMKIRGTGEGKRLMEYSINLCKKLYPNHDIKISAQVYLDKFYTDLGFKANNHHYLEDGIPHQGMILPIK